MAKEKDFKTDSSIFLVWYQKSEKQLENEVIDKQENNDKTFSRRRHYISFLPDFKSDQKLEDFGLSAFQKKVLQTDKFLTHFKVHRLCNPQASWSNKGINKKKKQTFSVCFQNPVWKSNAKYLSDAQGSLVRTQFSWHLTLKSHHKVTPGHCACALTPCRPISKLDRTSAAL